MWVKKKKCWIWNWLFKAVQPEMTCSTSCSSAFKCVFVEGLCFKPRLCHRRRQIKEGKGEKGFGEKGKWGEKPDSIDWCVSKEKGICGWVTFFLLTFFFKSWLDTFSGTKTHVFLFFFLTFWHRRITTSTTELNLANSIDNSSAFQEASSFFSDFFFYFGL